MKKTSAQIETVALSRNKLYKTYQFHGALGKGKDPEAVLLLAIKEIFLWLQSRFRQFDIVPDEIRIPEEKSQQANLLKSFRIDDGYIIETVYLPEEKAWSFRLTEPDMGTSSRPAVPGRIFMTNYGLRITEGSLEFGCQIVCSQPETITEDAEVFRPKLVRDLKESLGLTSIVELTYEAGALADQGTRKRYQSLLTNPLRNMPVVVIERKKVDLKEISLTSKAGYLPPVAPRKEEKAFYRETADGWAKSLCGIAYVFLTEEGAENCITITDTALQEITIGYGEKLSDGSVGEIWKQVKKASTNHSKRNDRYQFGRVLFLNEALAIKQKHELEHLQETNEFEKENETLKQRIHLLEEEATRREQLVRDFSEKYQEQKIQRSKEQSSYRGQERQVNDKISLLEKQINDLQAEVKLHGKTIKEYQAKEERPADINGFIRWVDSFYQSDLILLPRAKEELKKARNCDIDTMCDGIEVLAKVYRKWRRGHISEEEYIAGCKSSTDTPVAISPTGDASINRYAKQYKVHYGDGPRNKSNRRALDLHLKSGVDQRFLLRIYFFWDSEKEMIVIGSMPEHLPVV